MKGLFSAVGFKTAHVVYETPARQVGATKWSYWRLWNFALDGIFSFSTVPIRIWTYVGALIASVSLLYALWIVATTLILGFDVPDTRRLSPPSCSWQDSAHISRDHR